MRAAARRREQEEDPESKPSRRKPERPIPADFAVTPAMRKWAADKGYDVDLDRETFRFINHAHQNDRRCRDWLAAWRNWIDKAQEQQARATRRPVAAFPARGTYDKSKVFGNRNRT
ncbi:hypothetical protein [Acrocarpospora phusangensis]|uniref:hypothetical protein n=1 Tax=Acrocarpospora phusangensis TaxID=1070424 RepID=UPI00194DEA23|nr:hypothetical protein [Acrocarpospora phusangensis]